MFVVCSHLARRVVRVSATATNAVMNFCRIDEILLFVINFYRVVYFVCGAHASPLGRRGTQSTNDNRFFFRPNVLSLFFCSPFLFPTKSLRPSRLFYFYFSDFFHASFTKTKPARPLVLF